MRKTLFLLATAGTLVAAAQAANVPAPVAAKATAANVEFLEKGLSKTPQKREIGTLKAVAMLVAWDAQEAKQGDKRDAAVKVAEGVAKKAFPAALDSAKLLAGAAGGAGTPVKLHEQAKFSLEELMSSYRNASVGGLNLQSDIKNYGKKLSATDVDAAGVVGARNATIAAYTKLMPPDGTKGADLKQWEKLSDESERLGTAVATEAAKGAGAKVADIQKNMKALEANCAACHGQFKDK